MTTSRPSGRRFPDDFLWGSATASYQIEGARARGRPRAVDLGHVLPHAGQGAGRGHRRRRRRPLPPGPAGRRDDGRPRPAGVPVLDLVVARAAHRLGRVQPGRPRLLLRPRRPADRGRDQARRHALPLGPAAGARGRGRLDQPPHRRAVRRVRPQDGRGARRPHPPVDHAERAVVLGLPGLRLRRARAGPHRRRRRARRGPPPEPGPRPGRPGRQGRARRRTPRLRHAQPARHACRDGLPGGPRGQARRSTPSPTRSSCARCSTASTPRRSSPTPST